MIKRTTSRTETLHTRPEISLKDSYRLLRNLPLGSASDRELDQISDQISQLDNRDQIAALLARLRHR
ncbi:hypothetical protein [Motiliproteus sediminis]|uniref:hypothetical protein n=1 Tax=Motiliproteus sediminis TaxID=1468178 RepID=UPI001AF00E9C|nr:hypothetical protein [Motiliproteus sediminis]